MAPISYMSSQTIMAMITTGIQDFMKLITLWPSFYIKLIYRQNTPTAQIITYPREKRRKRRSLLSLYGVGISSVRMENDLTAPGELVIKKNVINI